MPAVLEAVDLAALLAEACAWALLTILVVLLTKLVSVLDFSVGPSWLSIQPLKPIADAIQSYLLAGAEDARQAVAGAMKATYDGLVWGFDEILGAFTDLAHATRGLALYLWHNLVQPFVRAIERDLRTAIGKVESSVATLTKTVAADLATAERYAVTKANDALTSAESFTRIEIKAVRQDFTAADAVIDARLDGIGTQAEALAASIAAAPDAVWGDLKKLGDVQNLADAVLLGVAGALGIHALTDATGLNSNTCEQNQKQVCNADPGQWLKLLEGIALLGVLFDFKLCYDFAETLLTDVGDLMVSIEDKAWSEFS